MSLSKQILEEMRATPSLKGLSRNMMDDAIRCAYSVLLPILQREKNEISSLRREVAQLLEERDAS